MFVKDKKTKVIINTEEKDYLEILEKRNRDKIFHEIFERLGILERETKVIKDILRGRQ